MSILPVGLTTTTQALTSQPTAPTAPTGATTGAGGIGGAAAAGASQGGFASTLANALDSVQATQAQADSLATQAATGSLTNVADYMVAADEANLQTQLTAAVRNNALQSFQQIMGMQL